MAVSHVLHCIRYRIPCAALALFSGFGLGTVLTPAHSLIFSSTLRPSSGRIQPSYF